MSDTPHLPAGFPGGLVPIVGTIVDDGRVVLAAPPAARARFVSPYLPAYTVGLLLERAWGLQVRCGACGHVARLMRRELESLPAGASVRELEPRLRCTAESCGAHAAEIAVINDTAEVSERHLEIYSGKVGPAAAKP